MAGVFMLWIEVELAWGLVHRRKIDLQEIARVSIRVRKILDTVLSLLETYRTPVTWTIVGHLLLDHCGKGDVNELPHSDMPRPNYFWSKDDWYRYDPCTDINRDPAWYGKDIVHKIVEYVNESKISHEIGCHSFSHQLLGDPGCGKDLARAEIKKCIELMKDYGIFPTVFVFPREYVGHLSALKEFGFVAFRDTPRKLYPRLQMERTISNLINSCLSLGAQFLSYYLLWPPHVVTLRNAYPGLWAVPGCLAYTKKPLIPMKFLTLKAIQGIDRAIKEDKIFSLSTHLRNFSQTRNFLSSFREILSYVGRKREDGVLETKTITELIKELPHGSK